MIIDNVSSPVNGNSSAWFAHDADLASWTWAHLVNRTDVCGGYYRVPDGVGGWQTQQTTHPRIADRGKVLLTPDVLLRHFRATYANHVVGLHTTSPDNTSRWAAVDIDKHGDAGSDPAANLAAALAWFDRLHGLGFNPLLSDSNGRGGFHLLAVFDEPVPTPRVFAFGRWLTDDHAAHGLAVRPETFPKQPRISEGGFGNWLRLPGRHHTRDHWSRVWDGSAWLEGEAAVAHILGLVPSPPSLIPADVQPPSAPQPRRVVVTFTGRAAGTRRLNAIIAAYMTKLPHLGEGQGRDDIAYNFASWLVRDMALPDAVALVWLEAWDSGNSPPKGRECLEGILANARKYGKRPLGCGRTDCLVGEV
jgi:hypothetical protein